MSSIDFLVIGAQKSGTTSLFEYMRRHPEIHMPPEKEVSFFSNWYGRGWEWYVATVLRNAPPAAICGEASIAYMVGTPFADVPRNDGGYRPSSQEANIPLEQIIPRRIYERLPSVRLICVLRDPVARAYSHYQMAVLDRVESRTFDEAIAALSTPEAIGEARLMRTSTNGYIANGEYHRILSGFLEFFSRDQLFVVFSNELSEKPAATLGRIFSFLGASSDVLPDNIETRYRAAATERRLPGLDLYSLQRTAARSQVTRTAWRRLPTNLRADVDRGYKAAGYRMAVWNARRRASQQDVPAAARAALIQHFTPDSRALSDLIGLDVPWLSDWQ
jgi:hypothetical protein